MASTLPASLDAWYDHLKICNDICRVSGAHLSGEPISFQTLLGSSALNELQQNWSHTQ